MSLFERTKFTTYRGRQSLNGEAIYSVDESRDER